MNDRTRRTRILRSLLSTSFLVAGLALPGSFPAVAGRAALSAADWVASDAGHLVHGSGSTFTIEGRSDGSVSRVAIGSPADDAAIHAGRLYLVRPDAIEVRALDTPGSALYRIPLTGVSGATPLRIAFVRDGPVVGHAGGLVVFDAPIARAMVDGQHRLVDRLPEVLARIPTGDPVVALAGGADAAWVAVGTRILHVAVPPAGDGTVAEAFTLDRPAAAVGADGGRLVWLTDAGLFSVDAEDAASAGSGVPRGPLFSGMPAKKLQLAGRAIRVAAGENGLHTWVDRTPEAITVNVSLTDFAFTPASVLLLPGDGVRWVNQGGFHNVVSCNGIGDPVQCPAAAVESFSSGAPTSQPFAFFHAFTLEGDNSYYCSPHVTLGMTGFVEVASATPPPPTVPDGTVGSVFRVTRLSADASSLELSWDADTCADQEDHNVLYGFGSGFPAVPGGSYTVAGAACATGADGSFVWNASPDPGGDPSGLLWFLPVATDGAGVEGGWGGDSSGDPRGTAAPDGSSGLCGVTERDVSNACGT